MSYQPTIDYAWPTGVRPTTLKAPPRGIILSWHDRDPWYDEALSYVPYRLTAPNVLVTDDRLALLLPPFLSGDPENRDYLAAVLYEDSDACIRAFGWWVREKVLKEWPGWRVNLPTVEELRGEQTPSFMKAVRWDIRDYLKGAARCG